MNQVMSSILRVDVFVMQPVMLDSIHNCKCNTPRPCPRTEQEDGDANEEQKHMTPQRNQDEIVSSVVVCVLMVDRVKASVILQNRQLSKTTMKHESMVEVPSKSSRTVSQKEERNRHSDTLE